MERHLNLATYYLLPLVELSKNSFGDLEDVITTDSNFINCYLTDQNHIAVKVESTDRLPSSIFESRYYFTDYDVDGSSILIFRVTPSDSRNLHAFRSGKYSQFTDSAKDKIIMFNGFTEKDEIIQILHRHPKLKAKLENELGITLSDEDEVKSVPHENNFITLTPVEDESAEV